MTEMDVDMPGTALVGIGFAVVFVATWHLAASSRPAMLKTGVIAIAIVAGVVCLRVGFDHLLWSARLHADIIS